MIFIGIDPGQTGAVAYVDEQGFRGYADTPIIRSAKATKGFKSEYDTAGMVAALKLAKGSGECHAIIESVHSMPGQGVSSSFGFGKGFGIWLGILAALEIPHSLVSPVRWKKAMLHDMTKDKGMSRIRAKQMFPSVASLFDRVKDDGRAEALLMAAYGMRVNGRQMPKEAELLEEPF